MSTPIATTTPIDLDTIDYLIPSWPLELSAAIGAGPTLILFTWLSIRHYQRGFGDTFQKLIYICIAQDMIQFLVKMFVMRMPQLGLFGFYKYLKDGFVPVIGFYVQVMCFCQQMLLILVVAINRLHSLLSPVNYKFFWERYLWPVILITLLIPQPIVIRITTMGVFYKQIAKDAHYIYVTGMRETEGKILFGQTLVVAFLTAICNLCSGIKLVIWMKKVDKNRKIKIQFHLYSFSIFAIQMIVTGTQLAIHILEFGRPDYDMCILICNIAVDLSTLYSIWFWLIMSKETRRLLWMDRNKIITSQQS